jgi:hypothetical protein
MSRYKQVYRAEQLPVFQNRMFDTAQAAQSCARGDLVMVQDLSTGLVFNQAFDPGLMHYSADYQNEQGHSAAFRAHLTNVAAVVTRHMQGKKLIEVGCGKALFLEQLQAQGFDIVGLDPTYEGSNPAVLREYFTTSTGLRGDALLLRHVLEHVQNPLGFLAQLRDANGGGGHIYIEVPCLDWIAANGAWFDLFYEHVNYFRLIDLQRMFGTVFESGHTFGGQYLYIVADLATLCTPDAATVQAFEFSSHFLSAIERSAAQIKLVSTGSDTTLGKPSVAIWGGASKGVIFSLLMQRAGVKVDCVVDISPAKQGKYLAATGLRVQTPQQALAQLPVGSPVFVMNQNYLSEIQALTDQRFDCITVECEPA